MKIKSFFMSFLVLAAVLSVAGCNSKKKTAGQSTAPGPSPGPSPGPGPVTPPPTTPKIFSMKKLPGDGNISNPVGLKESIFIEFNNAVDPTTVKGNIDFDIVNIRVLVNDENAALTDDKKKEFENILAEAQGNKIKITPQSNFLAGQEYIIQIFRKNTPLKDSGGNELDKDYYVSFRTENTAPKASSADTKIMLLSVIHDPYPQAVRYMAYFYYDYRDVKTSFDTEMISLVSRPIATGEDEGLIRDITYVEGKFIPGERYFYSAHACWANIPIPAVPAVRRGCGVMSNESFVDIPN